MANESKHTLKIENCPKLLEALLAHAGIYSHCKYIYFIRLKKKTKFAQILFSSYTSNDFCGILFKSKKKFIAFILARLSYG